MTDSCVVACDTGFLIRLVSKTSNLHDNAVAYLKHFKSCGCEMRMSTIAMAEFCVKGDPDELPMGAILPSSFNVAHSHLAGKCAKALHDARAKGVKVADDRIVICNDVKIMAQAQLDKCEYYLTSDSKSRRMYDVLVSAGLLSFKFVDIHVPCNEYFGTLF